MIKGYKNAGFDTLRVPVAWSNLMNDKYDIDPGYMDRVDEIVGWAINADMYVILNIHWDGGWWEKFPTEKSECMKNMNASGHRYANVSPNTPISSYLSLSMRRAAGTLCGTGTAAAQTVRRKAMTFSMR